MRKAAFLDRDGVINVDSAYVFRWEDFVFASGAVEGMRRFQEAGYLIVVVTNQSGIARGMYSIADFDLLTHAMCRELESQGVNISAVYHCPHHPKGSVLDYAIDCNCRKPKPGMLLKAADDLKIDLGGSLMVGDKYSDIAAARAAGVKRTYKIVSDYDEDAELESARPDHEFGSLLACAQWVTRERGVA